MVSGTSLYTSEDESFHQDFATLDANASDAFILNGGGDIIGIDHGNGLIHAGNVTYMHSTMSENVDFTNSLTARNQQIEVGAHITGYLSPTVLASGFVSGQFNKYNATLERSFGNETTTEHFSNRYNQYTVGGNVAFEMTDKLTGSVGAGYNFGDDINNSFNAQATLTYRFGGGGSKHRHRPSHDSSPSTSYREYERALTATGSQDEDQMPQEIGKDEVLVDQAFTDQKAPTIIDMARMNSFDATGNTVTVPVEDLDAYDQENQIQVASYGGGK